MLVAFNEINFEVRPAFWLINNTHMAQYELPKGVGLDGFKVELSQDNDCKNTVSLLNGNGNNVVFIGVDEEMLDFINLCVSDFKSAVRIHKKIWSVV